MIQFNLLPDVKIEYIKTKRTKRLVVMVATLSSGVALFIMISLFLLINVAQKQHLSNLSSDIKTDSKRLEDIEGIGKILTVQNQLLSLDKVHDQKPVASRLSTYIETLTPANISIANLEVNFTESKMTVSGKADQLADINKFVDTLKFTKYKIKETGEEKDAFSKVVLTDFAKREAVFTYTITLEFDPTIFDAKTALDLNVPSITTNRSSTEKPAALFQQAPIPNPQERQ